MFLLLLCLLGLPRNKFHLYLNWHKLLLFSNQNKQILKYRLFHLIHKLIPKLCIMQLLFLWQRSNLCKLRKQQQKLQQLVTIHKFHQYLQYNLPIKLSWCNLL